MIMAHHRPDLLEELLRALDDERNDIFLHIDGKSGREMSEKKYSLKMGRLIQVPGMNVSWGGYSQIACELRMLRTAVNNGPYAFYHLMTGSSYPLHSQDRIHSFFEMHAGQELLSFNTPVPTERVRYKWVFNEAGKYSEENWLRPFIRERFVRIQERLGFDFFKRFGMEMKKGLAYWSITDDAAGYLLDQEGLIKKMMRRSVCGDEIFVQTLLYNSGFRDRIYNYDDDDKTSLWLSTWAIEGSSREREAHSFCREDLAMLLSTDAMFGLKFEGRDGHYLINEIKKAAGREKTGSGM